MHGVQTVCWSALDESGAQQAQLFDKMLSSDPMPSLLLAWFLRTDQCLLYALVSYVPRSSSVLCTFKEYPNIGFHIVFNTSLIQFLYSVTFTMNRLVNLQHNPLSFDKEDGFLFRVIRRYIGCFHMTLGTDGIKTVERRQSTL